MRTDTELHPNLAASFVPDAETCQMSYWRVRKAGYFTTRVATQEEIDEFTQRVIGLCANDSAVRAAAFDLSQWQYRDRHFDAYMRSLREQSRGVNWCPPAPLAHMLAAATERFMTLLKEDDDDNR